MITNKHSAAAIECRHMTDKKYSTATIISCDTNKIDYYRDSVTGYSISNIRTPLS